MEKLYSVFEVDQHGKKKLLMTTPDRMSAILLARALSPLIGEPPRDPTFEVIDDEGVQAYPSPNE